MPVKRKTTRRKSVKRKSVKPRKVSTKYTIVCLKGKCRVYKLMVKGKRQFVVTRGKDGKRVLHTVRKGHRVYRTRAAAVKAAKRVVRDPAAFKQKLTKQPASKGRKLMESFVESGKGTLKKMPKAVKDAVSGSPVVSLSSSFGAKKGGKSKRRSGPNKRRKSKFGKARKGSRKMVSKKVSGSRMTPAQRKRLRQLVKGLGGVGALGVVGKGAHTMKKRRDTRKARKSHDEHMRKVREDIIRRRLERADSPREMGEASRRYAEVMGMQRFGRPINYGFGRFL